MPEDDSIRIETCCPSTIKNIIKVSLDRFVVFVVLCLTDSSLSTLMCILVICTFLKNLESKR